MIRNFNIQSLLSLVSPAVAGYDGNDTPSFAQLNVGTIQPLVAPCFAAMACATSPAVRRATIISDADKAAKAALEGENKLDAAKIPARTFAVVPFSVAETDTVLKPLGYGLADLLMNDLAKSPELMASPAASIRLARCMRPDLPVEIMRSSSSPPPTCRSTTSQASSRCGLKSPRRKPR